jgi:hypothetical protein
MKTLFSILSLVVVASLLAVPVMAQTPDPTPGPPPGMYIYWNIALHSPIAHGGAGTAQYEIIKVALNPKPTPGGLKFATKFLVDCEYLQLPDLTPLQLFVGPSNNPAEPFGKLIGAMQVKDGSATFLTARPPVIEKGTTVTIVRDGAAVMTGRF